MKILSVENVGEIIRKHGFENYLKDLMKCLRADFSNWEEFQKIPRPTMHVPNGLVELMPICGQQYYTFKYVNLHPKNPEKGLSTILATGEIVEIDTGMPLMVSEMNLLTALRTAATTAIATDLMSRKNSHVLAMIGTGAQSEFLVKAICIVRDIKEVRYFDIDPSAMDKFENNFSKSSFKLSRASSAEEAVRGADIITTCTACKAHVDVIKNEWVKNGVHINGIGGDSVGKTELELSILDRSRIVVEYLDQSVAEGEIQRWTEEEAREKVYAELHELIAKTKLGRDNDSQITLYDSVGMALEDYSALILTYELAERYGLGENLNMTPVIKDPKNLISIIN